VIAAIAETTIFSALSAFSAVDGDTRSWCLRVLVVVSIAGAVRLDAIRNPQTPARGPDVHFAATPQAAVDAMLDVAHVKARDIVYDLGSGDGRIVITAAKKYGARGVGIEIDPGLVKKAKDHAAAAGVANRVRFVTRDLFTANISEATVVTLYLLQSINERLRPKLIRELKPGTRIVSHMFTMGPEWPPEQALEVDRSRIFFWTIPHR